MADVSKIKLPSGVTYDIKDDGALPLTGGTVTGPVIFQDTISMDEATIGDLVVNGNASFTNNINVNTINSVAVGSSPKFTDTTYSSKTAASGGTDVSLVTTGEKYTWNNKSNLTIGTTATTAAAGNHAHGNITNGGDITATAPTIANGDQIVINDSSASKITNGPTFDGSTTNKYLSPKGTWESLPQGTAYTAGTGLSLSGTKFNHSNSVTAQTTQAVYPIKIDAQGHINAYGSAVSIPTKVSDLTNDSGFVTTDENVKSTTVTTATTYYLVGSTSSSTTTGGLSKHASAYIDVSADSNTGGLSTLTLGNNIADGTAGSKEGNIVLYGLGTSKASIYPNNEMSSNSVFSLPKTGGTLALTSAIPTKTSDLTNDSGFITSYTDEKVYVTGFIDSGATYYPILATGSGTATRQIDYYGALKYTSTKGSSSTKGTAILELGNNIASGTANNEYGVLRLYGTTTKYYDLKTYPDYPAANRTIYFPRYASDMYLTCTSSTSAVGGATTKPVYVDDTGCIKAVTSIPYSLLTGVPTVNSNTTGISISNHSTGSVTGVQSSTTTASKVTLGTAISVPNVTSVGSASTWTFEEKTIPNVTAAGSGSFTQGSFSGGSLTFAIDSTDNKQLNITFTAATHGADSHTHTAPTLGTAIKVQSKSGGGNGSAPTLGTAKSIPNVTGVSDVTVPIKNTSATTVVTSATHTVTDNGHTHSLS